MQSLKSKKKNNQLYTKILKQITNTTLTKYLQKYKNIFKSQISHKTK